MTLNRPENMHGFALRATNIQVEQQLKKSLRTRIVAFNPLLVISTAVSQLQLTSKGGN